MKKLFVFLFFSVSVLGQQSVPKALNDWKDWATWNDGAKECPCQYNQAGRNVCIWPSSLNFDVNASQGRFSQKVDVFYDSWLVLPGDRKIWPVEVTVNGRKTVVIEKVGRPVLKLKKGSYQVTGRFRWKEMPQRIAVPKETGIVTLKLSGKRVEVPNWDDGGNLWLQKVKITEEDREFMGVNAYSLLEDGIPVWLQTDIELSVSGKSREEVLGHFIPEGFLLSSVQSDLPAVVDDSGILKVQVRAGKWTVSLRMFRTGKTDSIAFAETVTPGTPVQMLAFKADPELRVLEIQGVPAIDATQTTFPQKWISYPVFQWNVKNTVKLDEKMRGSGYKVPKNIVVTRELWLNENGNGYVVKDTLSGNLQKVFRLDAAEGMNVGSVTSDGKNQLITMNPVTGAEGVELRTGRLNLEAVSTIDKRGGFSSSGWRVGADRLSMSLNLPPGWRLFECFGAEHVRGGWLRSWDLLDLFLLLIFSLSVYRLWGIKAGIVAFVSFVLMTHEANAPRYTWFFLLIPLAMLKAVPDGTFRKLIEYWKYFALVILVFILSPFVYYQVQTALYPQLEYPHMRSMTPGYYPEKKELRRITLNSAMPEEPEPVIQMEQKAKGDAMYNQVDDESRDKAFSKRMIQQQNLSFDPGARIQTGPGIPEWNWKQVSFSWSGPVDQEDTISPVLIPPFLTRLLIVVRLIMITLLISCLLEIRKITVPLKLAAVILITIFSTSGVQAQIPDKEMLETLRQRLLEKPDCFPYCADIPSVSLRVRGNAISMTAEVHASEAVAVPLPGRVPVWSPSKVTVDGAAVPLIREGGFVWVLVKQGVHTVIAEGYIPQLMEWQWTFYLKPRYARIDAPDWEVTGLDKDGVPEQQIFLVRKKKDNAERQWETDRKDYHSLVLVERTLEMGLTWQVHTVVSRLSATGKAISLEIPLVNGEKVMSSGIKVEKNVAEVRLSAAQRAVSWDSELTVQNTMSLKAEDSVEWVEKWRLLVSPVWHVDVEGFPAQFQYMDEQVVPVYYPWPGETLSLAVSRPEAVKGETMTIRRVNHSIGIGPSTLTSSLNLSLQSSLGGDFVLDISDSAEVTSVKRDNVSLPVRQEARNVIIPVQPGDQVLDIVWKEKPGVRFKVNSPDVTFPVDSTNISTTMSVPGNRWVLFVGGPLRGPAVRFWGILLFVMIIGLLLGSTSYSPLSKIEWLLLGIGLTQIPLVLSLFVVGWLFLLKERGQERFHDRPVWQFNISQLFIIGLTCICLMIFVTIVHKGLMGSPEMFIVGNGSSWRSLKWFKPSAGTGLPDVTMVSVSIWFYRVLMLFWALWLAHNLINWLKWGWGQFASGGIWKKKPVIKVEQ